MRCGERTNALENARLAVMAVCLVYPDFHNTTAMENCRWQRILDSGVIGVLVMAR